MKAGRVHPAGRSPLAPTGLPLVLIALPLILAAFPLAAQNEPPPDGPVPVPTATPAPSVTPATPQARVQQLLQTKPFADIARYLAADSQHRAVWIDQLAVQAHREHARVEALLTAAKSAAEPAITPSASAPQSPDAALANGTTGPAVPPGTGASGEDAGAGGTAADLTATVDLLAKLELRLRARSDVEDLGAADFHQRSRAAAELARMGGAAVTDLSWGVASPDPQVADTCLRMLVDIRGRGYIGIEFDVIPPALSADEAARKGLPFVGGVSVAMVQDGFAGAQAGLKPGDIIIALGPLRIQHWTDLLTAVAVLGPEYSTTVTYVRDGKIATVPMKLGTRPAGLP